MSSPRTFECPVCGGQVPVTAKACHHCGACDKSGWNEDAAASDGLDLPDDSFDYEKFKQEEFGKPRRPQGLKFMWWITAVFLLVVTVGLTIYNMLFGQ